MNKRVKYPNIQEQECKVSKVVGCNQCNSNELMTIEKNNPW
jgi:hypothetical protein